MRKVFECFRCGFAWHSPWWEPTFVGRRMAIKEHEVMHDVALANALSWQSGGAQAERERIIKLLEEHAGIGEDCLEHRDLCNCTFNGRAIDIIALIKGENK